MDLELLRGLAKPSGRRILLVAIEGLEAPMPVLDELARRGTCGLHAPLGPLALLGYDPKRYRVGEGVLRALEVGFELEARDVAFCGRAAADVATLQLDDVEVHVRPLPGDELVLVLRGDGLGADVADTDPGRPGARPLRAAGRDDASRRTAALVDALAALVPEGLYVRGASRLPAWPRLTDVAQLRATCLARTPMVRGASRLAGLEVVQDLAAVLAGQSDLAFLDLQADDEVLAPLLDRGDDVVVITCTGARPSPVVVVAPTARRDAVERLDGCASGGLGPGVPAHTILPLALSHAGRLARVGS